MIKHKNIQSLIHHGVKAVEITFRGPTGYKIKGVELEYNGKVITIEPQRKTSGTIYFVRWGNGKSDHYTKRSSEGFLPTLCKDLGAYKYDLFHFLFNSTYTS